MPNMFSMEQWIDRVITLNSYRGICGIQREYTEDDIINKVLLSNLSRENLLWIVKYCAYDKPKTLDEFKKWYYRNNIDRA